MPRHLLRYLSIGTLLIMSYCTLAQDGVQPHTSPQFSDGKFRNPVPMKRLSFRENVGLAWTFAFNKPAHTTPSGTIPVRVLTRAQLLEAADNTLFRLGH